MTDRVQTQGRRALHGVNLAGWLTLESWVTPELFADTGTLEEDELVRAMSEVEYRRLVTTHRKRFITRQDFERIAARGLNAVRIEVPWYVFGGKGPKADGRVGCIEQVDAAFDWAGECGIGVLLAVIPDAELVHMAEMSSVGPVAERRRGSLLRVTAALAKRYAADDAFVGIELGGEPRMSRWRLLGSTDGVAAHVLRNYYREAYSLIRRVAGTGPVVVIPDAGAPDEWHHFMAHDRYENVWLDCPLYRVAARSNAPATSGIRDVMRGIDRELEQARKSELPIMVGKWSAGLPFVDTLMTPEGRVALERLFVSQQLSRYERCQAWFFQSWKTSERLSAWDARVALASFEKDLLD